MDKQILVRLIVIAIIAAIVYFIEMDAQLKKIAYFIIGLAVIFVILPLIGINIL